MNIMNKFTLRGLKKNKTRTIVTIIGVILSAAMITAVTTFASSIQNFLLDYAISSTGDWHLNIDIDNLTDYNKLSNDDRIESMSTVKEVGYAPLVNGNNEYKPYLYIMELDSSAFDSLPIHLTEGRLPENSKEVLLTTNILENGGVDFKLGQEIELDIGNRYIDGMVLNQHNPYLHIKDGEAESFQANERKTFTVVGFYKRFPHNIEGFSAPGYSILTCLDQTSLAQDSVEDVNLSLYIKAKKPRQTYQLQSRLHEEYEIPYSMDNHRLLQYQGVSNISGFSFVLGGMVIIVMALIIIGSISLIYNSFSISISERRKQFGLLSSVGATRKQLINSVFFEALFIATIGIPLGIGSGILGIGITLYKLKGNFAQLLGEAVRVELGLHVSTFALVLALILSLITILISAYIPARKVKKTSTLDAVRQASDIKLTSKTVKTSKLTRKLFGIEGDLALKNFKRNKKIYRSTVFSLFLSVFLFISTSAFSMYLTDSVEDVFTDYNYDLEYAINDPSDFNQAYMSVYERIQDLDGVYDSSIVRRVTLRTHLEKEAIDTFYYSRLTDQDIISDGDDPYIYIDIYSLDHKTFVNYLDELGLNKDKFQNPDDLTGIVVDKQRYYDNNGERYGITNILKNQSESSLSLISYMDESIEIPIQLGGFADKVPLGLPSYTYNSIIFIIDDSVLANSESHMKDFSALEQSSMYFKTENPSKYAKDIEKIISDGGLEIGYIYNAAERVEEERNIITIINVFAYGFIVLMSLVAMANVFNTITTNINLRRREFAMLKSVGISNRGFNKMLNYECIFYGLKALLYGIPASTLVTYLIYLIINQGVDTDFYLPTRSIIISVLSVFLVVFISMMYSMRKIRKENILDALRN